MYFKIILLGKEMVGKSCLILQYMYNEFCESYDKTIFDCYSKKIILNNQFLNVHIIDSPGCDEYDYLRDNDLLGCDGFLVVFSLDDVDSFNMLDNFHGQILNLFNDPPIILIGNKSDKNRKISKTMAIKKAIEWKVKYFETSAKIRENVDLVFNEIINDIDRKKNHI